jgi:membrane dipeptidase
MNKQYRRAAGTRRAPLAGSAAGLSRRRMLAAAAGLLAAPLAGRALEAEQIDVSPAGLERVQRLFAARTVVDFHTHLGIWQGIGVADVDPAIAAMGRDKLASNIREYIDAGVNCLYLDTISDLVRTRIGRPGNKDRDFRDDEAWEDYLRQHTLMQELLDQFPMTVAKQVEDVRDIAKRGELAVILSTEGAHMVERRPERLETLAAHGLRRLQPIHYVASQLGDSQTDPPRFGGLSPLGRDVLARGSELGMLIDMAHASFACVEQAASLIDRPLALSHTMVKYDSQRFGDYRQTRQRWISPEHARLVAETGGVIGTFPIRAPFGVDTLDAFVEALKVMVDTVGIDHVAWSTDLGEPVRPAFLQDYRQFPRVCARLLDSGFSDEDLAKFAGGNALRVQAAA